MTPTEITALAERLERNSGWRNVNYECVTDPAILSEAANALRALLAEREAMRGALVETRRLVSEAARGGFADEDAIRALYVNNGAISRTLSALAPPAPALKVVQVPPMTADQQEYVQKAISRGPVDLGVVIGGPKLSALKEGEKPTPTDQEQGR